MIPKKNDSLDCEDTWNMSIVNFPSIFQGWKTVLVWFNRIPWTCKMIRASSRATSWTKGRTEQRLKLVSEANFWFDQVSQISATCRTCRSCRTCSFLTQFHNSLHVRHLLRLSDILSVSKFILSLSEFVISSLCGSGIDLSVSVCDVLRRAELCKACGLLYPLSGLYPDGAVAVAVVEMITKWNRKIKMDGKSLDEIWKWHLWFWRWNDFKWDILIHFVHVRKLTLRDAGN